MSDTTYVHEVTQRTSLRVTLTMDADEARAMADIAAAAIDGALLAEGGEVLLRNAENVYRWALRAATTLDLAKGSGDEE